MSADADVGHDGNGVSSPVLGDTHNASAIAAGLVVLCRFQSLAHARDRRGGDCRDGCGINLRNRGITRYSATDEIRNRKREANLHSLRKSCGKSAHLLTRDIPQRLPD